MSNSSESCAVTDHISPHRVRQNATAESHSGERATGDAPRAIASASSTDSTASQRAIFMALTECVGRYRKVAEREAGRFVFACQSARDAANEPAKAAARHTQRKMLAPRSRLAYFKQDVLPPPFPPPSLCPRSAWRMQPCEKPRFAVQKPHPLQMVTHAECTPSTGTWVHKGKRRTPAARKPPRIRRFRSIRGLVATARCSDAVHLSINGLALTARSVCYAAVWLVLRRCQRRRLLTGWLGAIIIAG